MLNTDRPPTAPSAVALFRYSIVAQVEALRLRGQSAAAAVRQVAGWPQADTYGNQIRISARTLERWRAAYAQGGLTALEPQPRPRTLTSVALAPELVAFLQAQKQADPRASVPELLRRARVEGLLPADQPVDRTTAWRACRRLGLATRARPSKREGDPRRWCYPHRMQCMLADGKHFRAGSTRLRRVALFFLDDATRYALHAQVGPSESAALFLRGLYAVVRQHGLPDLLYLDRGPGFVSDDTLAVVEGGLGAWLVHGTARYPTGHGAIERFHRTAYEQVLRALDGAAQVDPDEGALTLRLGHYLERYNDTPHETLGGDTPRQRWEQGRPLRFPADEADLYRRFVVCQSRKVAADHVLQMQGRLWEVPRGLGGTWVEVARHVLDGRLWVRQEGRWVPLAPLDAQANATDRRARPASPAPAPGEGVPTTAATAAFDQDLRPLVDDQGGFPPPPDDPPEEDPCPPT